jgi:hypothetical protein
MSVHIFIQVIKGTQFHSQTSYVLQEKYAPFLTDVPWMTHFTNLMVQTMLIELLQIKCNKHLKNILVV